MTPTAYDFAERLAFSRGVRQGTDIETLRELFPGCADVRKTDEASDRAGVDYIVTLRRNAEVLVDAKARAAGCSRFWRDEPEIALELWSVMPGGKYGTPQGKAGWTLSESSPVDYILFTFDPSDCQEVFLFPFQLLRLAFVDSAKRWMQTFKVDVQDSRSWQSQAVFVPLTAAYAAVQRAGVGWLWLDSQRR